MLTSITRLAVRRVAFAAASLCLGVIASAISQADARTHESLRSQAKASANPFLHTVDADGTLRFDLTERIKHPHFWWPRTLLNYHVVVLGSSAPVERWTLKDEVTGKPVPVQISEVRTENGKTVAATVSFFSDLPTGGKRSFTLNTTGKGTPPAAAGQVIIWDNGAEITLTTGAMGLRIPSSREIGQGRRAPGPILAFNDGKRWVGASVIDSPKKIVRKMTTEILDRGPLFSRVRVTYDFDGGARYTATIKAPVSYSFIEFTEEMSGLTVEDQADFNLIWTDLKLTQREGDAPIDKPHVLYYRGEDPYFTGPDRVENPAEEFYYRVGHSAADSTTFRTMAEFSNPETGHGVGLCVLDGAKWDDGDYSIWAASDTLCVKFRYRDGRLEWRLPLAGKSRQLGFATYNMKEPWDGDALKKFSSSEDGQSAEASVANRGIAQSKNLMGLINSRYGGMSLDVVKDWQLNYPDSAAKPAPQPLLPVGSRYVKCAESVEAYDKALWGDHEALHVEGNWFSPVSLRQMNQWIVPGFHKFRDALTAEQRERATALLLFQSYLATREEISPMRHMLKGHPNFMADWKYPLLAGAWLFPNHPLAREWAEQFEKFIELAGVFYVRPEVKAWEAKGGRWTENIGTYNWAYLEPATKDNEMGLLYDSRNRMATPGMALHCDYLTGIVTAPVKLGKDGQPFEFTPGTPLLPDNGFQRIHPPQGAHASRRHIPGCVESLARALKNYAPLTAEHLLWIDRRPAGSPTNFESEAAQPAGPGFAQGTNPRLRSAKYTGYGIVLRAAVDTPEEITVYLQQVDKGPNYRWGFGNENGGGDIYYYAGGNSYAGHFVEDAGDRRVTDAELTCNTGVYKDSTFRGIGMNDLTEPLYDLGSAQFAEILARPGADAYSWPDYEARSVMLVGHDYIVTYDTMNNRSRVSWNTVKGQDKMPNILSIHGENAYRTTQTSVGGHGEVTEGIRLEPYKSGTDRMTLISHRSDLKIGRGKKNSKSLVSEVVSPEGSDFVYQQRATFQSEEDGRVFSGRAGVIRQFKDARTELNLFSGERIGTATLQLAVDNPSLGVSAAFKTTTDVLGQYFSRTGGKLIVTLPGGIPQGAQLFVNGASANATAAEKSLTVQLPPGEGRWQLTSGPVTPMAPGIAHSVARADGATIFYLPTANATGYRIESSQDGGTTWTNAGTSKTAEFTIKGIKAPGKVHLRVIALNGAVESLPGRDYPVYVTGKPAGPPEGLRFELTTNEATAFWGEVLGAKEYVLYRKKVGEKTWKVIHRGAERSYRDQAKGVVPATREPGLESNASVQPAAKLVIYEYAVACIDGIGESEKSLVSNTDPGSWRNWNPAVPLHYKRRSAYWLPPFVKPEQVPPATYPE